MAFGFLKYLRWPLWVAELATSAKSFKDNPLIGSRRLNRLGLHQIRLRLAVAMTAWRRLLLASGLSRADREDFRRQGFVKWHGVLTDDQFERMRTAILERVWSGRDMIQGHAITRRIPVDRTMLQAIPELRQLIRSPRWRGLLSYVAATRAEPHYYIQTIFTHRTGEEEDPQNAIHSDTFHATMKAWLFLTDVAMEDGPLAYVPGSHRLIPGRAAWEQNQAMQASEGPDPLSARGSLRVEPEELKAMGLPPLLPFDVPANTLVVADTFGFHARSPSLKPSVRVELWAYVRRNPFLPWTGFSPASLPFLRDRQIHIFWWLQDRFPQIFGLPTHPFEGKRPDEL